MNEPPGARWRVPLTALTIAEYFRDQKHQNVLLLMDNVFRFVQAGAEVSSLLGRLPSRVGYQPTLATEVAALQERIASVAGAAVTAIQAVYVPADDFTDPAVTAISSHMDSVIMLSRGLAAEGFYPAVDPLASSSALLDPLVVGDAHYRVAERARETLARFKELQDIIALARRRGARRRRPADRQARAAAAALPHASPSPSPRRSPARRAQRARARRPSPAARRSSTARPTTGRRARSTWSATSTRRAPRSGGRAGGARRMRLRIVTPLEIVVDEQAGDLAARRGRQRRLRHPAAPRRFPDPPDGLGRQLDRRRRRRAPLRGARRRAHGQRRAGRSPSRRARRSPATIWRRSTRPCSSASAPRPTSERSARADSARLHLTRDPPDHAPPAARGGATADGVVMSATRPQSDERDPLVASARRKASAGGAGGAKASRRSRGACRRSACSAGSSSRRC